MGSIRGERGAHSGLERFWGIVDGWEVREVSRSGWVRGLAVGLGVVALLGLLARWSGGRRSLPGGPAADDLAVQGVRVSVWLRSVADAGGVAPVPAPHAPDVERALAALKTAGADAWPMLVEQACAPVDRRFERWAQWIRLESMSAKAWEVVERDQRRRETALGVLERERPPGDWMVARVRVALQSGDEDTRVGAIRCLGCSGEPRSEAARVLAGVLASGRVPDDLAALEALVRLGPGVTEAAPALVVMARARGFDVPGLTGALGHAGTAAAAVLPDLERALRSTTERGSRLRLALAWDRLVSERGEGWRGLEQAALEPAGAESTLRELAQLLDREGVREPRYAVLLAGASRACGRRWPTGCGPVLDVWQRLDPAGLRVWFGEALQEAVDGRSREAVEVAGEWLRRQPGEEPPRRHLRRVVEDGGADAPRAALQLAHAARLSLDEKALLGRVVHAPSTDERVRDALDQLLKRE